MTALAPSHSRAVTREAPSNVGNALPNGKRTQLFTAADLQLVVLRAVYLDTVGRQDEATAFYFLTSQLAQILAGQRGTSLPFAGVVAAIEYTRKLSDGEAHSGRAREWADLSRRLHDDFTAPTE